MSFLVLPAAVAFLLSSCGDDYLYEKKLEIANQSWTYRDTLRFDFTIADTTFACDLLLEVRHAADYGFQNLYVQMHTRFPSGKEDRQVVSLELADKIGIWQGDCGGKWCDVQIPLQERVVFTEAGKYSLAVEQFMRQSPLPGIESMKLVVKRLK